MATLNPLEKKARSSFWKGFIIALLIGIIISAVLGLLYFKAIGEEKKRIAAQKDVVVLKQDVKSGEEIDASMLTTQKANAEVVSQELLTKSAFDELSTITDDSGETTPVKVIAKIDIPAKSMLSSDMVAREEEAVTNDQREQEYNMINLPVTLTDGDTIDIRFRLPSGQDYIVISKKKVKLVNLGESYSSDTIIVNVTEDEILTMSAAIVEAYQISGSYLYATKYTSPGMQNVAQRTYAPTMDIINLITSNPNIVEEARNELRRKFVDPYNNYRGSISTAIEGIDERTRASSVEAGTGDEQATQRSERQTYLENMGS